MYVEVRDSQKGYLLPVRDGPGALPDGQSCWDVVVAAVSCHLEIQVDILAGPGWGAIFVVFHMVLGSW